MFPGSPQLGLGYFHMAGNSSGGHPLSHCHVHPLPWGLLVVWATCAELDLSPHLVTEGPVPWAGRPPNYPEVSPAGPISVARNMTQKTMHETVA